MQHVNPSNLIDKLLPLDALPERMTAASDAASPATRQPVLPQRMTELIARLHGQFASQGVLAERIVQLFGGNPLGIAQRLPKSDCICVNLARRILLDRAARERVRLPPDLMPFLDTLNSLPTPALGICQFNSPTKLACNSDGSACSSNASDVFSDGGMVFLFAPDENWMARDPWLASTGE